ncbi:MAG: hypothetical protein DMG13_20895 [Acidobacteria bacterium]|nr:MAG: hypothetical protein DMG13_20895 [Acidobacteriota bacterium]
MKGGMMGTYRVPLVATVALLLVAAPVRMGAQGGQRSTQPPPTARSRAAIDLTGTWVSVITEDWTSRMITPRKGNFDGVPINSEGRRIANAWDPAKDEAAGEQCKGYGAVGVMRQPGRMRISWQDDSTLKVELEAGNQTRLFHFGPTQPATGEPIWQGYSEAEWQNAITRSGPLNGNLKVVTTRMRPGYSRKNGVPYSANAHLTEYFHHMTVPNGDQWLTLISELRDPQYYAETWVVSSHFKKVPDGSKWNPEPCLAR